MLAVLVIKVGTKKMAGIIFIDDIQPNHITAIRRFPFKMTIDIIVSERRELPVRTFTAFVLSLFAQLRIPLVFTDRLISTFAI